MKILPSFLILFTTIFNIGICQENFHKVEDRSNLKILTPSLATRKISKITLNNGLKIYLISDSRANQSAAALSVMVGSWQDPKQYPGTAHFLEHMLFMGSSPYPNEADFMRYIGDHGGQTNAFTAPDRTVYAFSINNASFEDALDRFAHFFIDPIFNPSCLQRELFAVDQEFAKNIENDEWRKYQVSKEIGNPNHPNALFCTGNASTLSKIPRDVFINWYKKYYSANLMHLVIYSPLPLDDLTKMAIEKFKNVPTKEIKRATLTEKLSSPQQEGHFIYISPIQNIQKLYLEWEFTSPYVTDESKSADLIAYTLKRGNAESLLEYLKKEKLVQNLLIQTEKIGPYHLLLQIEIDLSALGLKNINKVIEHVFEAIAGLKKSGIPSYIFNEKQTMAKLNFEYQSRTDPFSYIMKQATNLIDEDFATYPQKTILSTHFNSQRVEEILNLLTPSRCQFYILADPKKTDITPQKKERWMGGEYTIVKIPQSLLTKWIQAKPNPHIKLPNPNHFIPSKLITIPSTNSSPFTSPLKIADNNHCKVFFSQDNFFKTPKACIFLHLYDPLLDGTIHTSVLVDLYLYNLYETLQPTLLLAQEAGLTTSFRIPPFALEITIDGYNEKVSLLLEEILTHFKKPPPTEEDFDTYFEKLKQKYENIEKTLPLFQAEELLSHLINPNLYTGKQKSAILKSLTYEDFEKFYNNLFKKVYIKGFFTGNLSLKNAESTLLDVQEILKEPPFLPSEHYKRRILNISEGPFMISNKTNTLGNAAILTIDEGEFSFKKRAAQQILSTALKEAFFAALRTKQKTAYIAKSFDAEIQKKLFQTFLVQSASHDILDLRYRFEFFLEDFVREIRSYIPQERFESIKDAHITKLQILPPNLFKMTKRLDTLAFEYNGDFDWIKKRIDGFKSLTYENFISQALSFISQKNKKRLAILIQGKGQNKNSFFYENIKLKDLAQLGTYKSEK